APKIDADQGKPIERSDVTSILSKTFCFMKGRQQMCILFLIIACVLGFVRRVHMLLPAPVVPRTSSRQADEYTKHTDHARKLGVSHSSILGLLGAKERSRSVYAAPAILRNRQLNSQKQMVGPPERMRHNRAALPASKHKLDIGPFADSPMVRKRASLSE